ncbi:unnamed protein product, partial [Brassica oleracea var. botrytis]
QLFYFFRGAIPVFENLLHLSITTMSECCWRGLVFLLNNCPNLETLTIKGTLHYDTYSSVCECLSGYSFLMSCPVKVSFVQMPYQGRVALISCTSEQTLIVHLVAQGLCSPPESV